MTEHDEHSSFIKTPQQLVVVILLAFLITGIVLLVQLVSSTRSADPYTLSPDSVSARIQPVGRVEFGAPAAEPGKGKGAMPPKAGSPTLSDAEIRAAIEFMVSQSK